MYHYYIGALLYRDHITGIEAVTQYTHVRNENSNTKGSSPNVVQVMSIPLRTAIKGKNSLPLGVNSFFLFKRNSFLKREIIVENHCFIQ